MLPVQVPRHRLRPDDHFINCNCNFNNFNTCNFNNFNDGVSVSYSMLPGHGTRPAFKDVVLIIAPGGLTLISALVTFIAVIYHSPKFYIITSLISVVFAVGCGFAAVFVEGRRWRKFFAFAGVQGLFGTIGFIMLGAFGGGIWGILGLLVIVACCVCPLWLLLKARL